MNQTNEGPAPARTGPTENAAARKHLEPEPTDDQHQAASAGDLLRQLSRGLLDGPHDEALQRLHDVAVQGAEWAARGLVDRTSASAVLLTAAEAAGVSQTEALHIVGDAFAGRAEAR